MPRSNALRRIAPWLPMVLVVVAVPCAMIYFSPPLAADRHAHNIFAKAKKTINPEDLREWAKNLASTQSDFQRKGKSDELPDYVVGLTKQTPSFLINSSSLSLSDNLPYLTLQYGGGFFSWGFDVGPTNFSRKSDSDHTSIEWVPGIYFRREGVD